MRLHSLTTKFAIANILPTLILTPLLCLYLLYALENLFTQQLFTHQMAERLARRSTVNANRVSVMLTVARNPAHAPQLLATLKHRRDAQITLLAQDGTVLGEFAARDAASGLPSAFAPTQARATVRIEMPADLQTGTPALIQTSFVAAESLIPAQPAPSQETLGVANEMANEMANEIAEARAEFALLRWVVLAGAGVTVLLGLGLGVELSRTVTGPLQLLTRQIQTLAAGRSPASVIVHHKIVRRKDEIGILAQSFNQMAARLQEVEALRQRQLAATVHELARPLTGMRAAVETLADGAAEDREIAVELLTGIGGEIERLERLLATLHSLDQRVIRPLQLHRGEVDLGRLLHAITAQYELAAEKGDILLASRVAPQRLPVYADEDRVLQVLVNLLDNALKFTPPGGRIVVEATATTHAAQISVADSGVGISPDEQLLLFTHFYRGSESRPLEKRGMGLGLAICREIVVAHGGKIWVESEAGQGTTVFFTLPFVQHAMPHPFS